MHLESIILIEVTQTQNDKYHMYSLISDFKHKAKKIKICLKFTIPKNLDNTEDSKRDIHGSKLSGRENKTRSPE